MFGALSLQHQGIEAQSGVGQQASAGRFIALSSGFDRFISADGENWTQTADYTGSNGAMQRVAVDPVSGRMVGFVSTSTEIFYSDDFGLTWTTTGFNFGGSPTIGRSSMFYFGGHFWCARGSTVTANAARSADGINWTPLADRPNTSAMQLAPWLDGKIAALHWTATGPCYTSADLGVTWDPFTSPLTGNGKSCVIPATDRVLLCSNGPADAPNFAYSDDGAAFTPITITETNSSADCRAMKYSEALDGALMLRTTYNGFVGSNADGSAWAEHVFTSTEPLRDVDHNDSCAVFFGNAVLHKVTSLSPFTKIEQPFAGMNFLAGLWHPTAES